MASGKPKKQPTKEDVVSQLIIAVQAGEYNLVKSILEGKGHNFAVQDIVNTEKTTPNNWTGTTALYEACKKHTDSHRESQETESSSMVKLLLDHGADPDIAFDGNIEEGHALHLAVQRGDLTLVRLLLEGTASVNLTHLMGESALHLCCFIRDRGQPTLEILTTLINYKADVNLQAENGYTPLHYSCDNQRPDLAKALLENGALATIQGNDGNSPLHLAVRSDDFTSVRIMLEEGKASANQTNNDGQSALHLCCNIWDGNEPALEILTTLMKYKADVNLQDKSGSTPLHYSCVKKRPDLTKALLQNGALTTIQDNSGNSPLHLAVRSDDLTSVRVILEEGKASVNQTNNAGQSAMHFGCHVWEQPALEILTTLIKYKADVNLQDKSGCTPMHYCCSNDQDEHTTALLENGALATIQDNNGDTPLHFAVRCGDLTSVKKMLEEGKASVNQTNVGGQSALHLCCEWPGEHSFDILVTLIKHKADVNLQDKDGCTPMHLSCKSDRPDLTTELLENGALATIQDNGGNSPLHLAVCNGELTLIRKMLEVGKGSANQTNNDGHSALHLCCRYWCNGQNRADILATLIKYKADVNIQDNDGLTPMHISCNINRPDLTAELLENGALATIQDNSGNSPLHLAVCSCDLTSVRKMLEEGKASANLTNNEGQSALHLCCKYTYFDFPTNYLEKVTTLINHKADVNLQDKNGKTPLHLSCMTNADDLTTTLVQKGALVTIQDNTGKCPLHIAIEKDDKQHNERENSLTLRILHLVDSRLTEPNENIELIIEAYEVIGLSASCSDLIECMGKATQLREEHNIKKRTLELKECYGFHKEWETIEELEACRGDEKQLKLQATLARERIYQGETEMLVELINEHLVADVLEASESEAGKLLEHHLDIWTAQTRGSYEQNYVNVIRAWRKMIDEHFDLFDTRAIIRFVRVTIENMHFEDGYTFSDFLVTLLSSTIVLIMKLYRRNRQEESVLQDEQTLAKELFGELLDAAPVVSAKYGNKKWLQYLIIDINFSLPCVESDVFSRSPYDWDLTKVLLESGIEINEVDSYGSTVLHYALNSIRCDLEKPLTDSLFSQDVADQSVKSISLLLEKGVYPNARNKKFKTARDILLGPGLVKTDGMEVIQRISDVLQSYEQQYAMTLKHKAAFVVKESGLPYEDSLPKELVNFVNLQGDKPIDVDLDDVDLDSVYDDYDFDWP